MPSCRVQTRPCSPRLSLLLLVTHSSSLCHWPMIRVFIPICNIDEIATPHIAPDIGPLTLDIPFIFSHSSVDIAGNWPGRCVALPSLVTTYFVSICSVVASALWLHANCWGPYGAGFHPHSRTAEIPVITGVLLVVWPCVIRLVREAPLRKATVQTSCLVSTRPFSLPTIGPFS
ncbi:hypothetical protein V8F33_005630 [Rhypophila sp. PSN 637]